MHPGLLTPAGTLLAVALLGSPGSVAAQEWFTAEACRVSEARIDTSAYPPDLQADFQAALTDIPNPNGRLWRITAPGGAVSHLWGTFHTPDPLLLDLPQTFRSILADARVVALEFDLIPETRDELNNAFDIATLWRPLGSVPDARTDISPRCSAGSRRA